MRADQRKRLEAAGWKIGGVKDFLGLDDVEAQMVEVKAALVIVLRKLRARYKVTQTELAQRLGSSQSRIAKIEAGDPSVSMELLFRSLFAVGAKKSDILRSMK